MEIVMKIFKILFIFWFSRTGTTNYPGQWIIIQTDCVVNAFSLIFLDKMRNQQALQLYREKLARRAQFAQLIAEQQGRLREAFSETASPKSMGVTKANVYNAIRADYQELKSQWEGANEYDNWFSSSLNNAKLASVSIYRRWVPGLHWYLSVNGLPAFYSELEALSRLAWNDRRLHLESWLESALSGPRSGAAERAVAENDRSG